MPSFTTRKKRRPKNATYVSTESTVVLSPSVLSAVRGRPYISVTSAIQTVKFLRYWPKRRQFCSRIRRGSNHRFTIALPGLPEGYKDDVVHNETNVVSCIKCLMWKKAEHHRCHSRERGNPGKSPRLRLDSRVRGSDGLGDFLRGYQRVRLPFLLTASK